jgi:hypothetical protein
MKEIYFYALFAIIVALQSMLIISGFLSPLSSYSTNNILFSLFLIIIVIYMGWDLAKLGLKKVAIKGVIAAIVSIIIISLFSVIGYILKRPILGITLPSIYYLPIPFLSMALLNVILYAFFAVLGAWLAKEMKPSRKIKKK